LREQAREGGEGSGEGKPGHVGEFTGVAGECLPANEATAPEDEVRWQAAAKFFLAHLLDGDPASNNLSFQWVASTFGAKPYLFNRENLEKYTDGKFCRGCARANDCPFGKSYEQIDEELFQ
jgi:hypothetical protein